MNTKILLVIVAILILGGVAYGIFNGGNTSNTTSENVAKIPDLTLKDYGGNEHSLREIDADIVVFNSWASWCPFCVNELPDFIRVQEAFADEIKIIGINRGESLNTAKGYTDEYKITDGLLYLMDESELFYKQTGGFSMPETIFTTNGGEILLHKRGPLTFEQAKDIIEDLLEKIEE